MEPTYGLMEVIGGQRGSMRLMRAIDVVEGW